MGGSVSFRRSGVNYIPALTIWSSVEEFPEPALITHPNETAAQDDEDGLMGLPHPIRNPCLFAWLESPG